VSLSKFAYDRFKDMLFARQVTLGAVMSQSELSRLLDVPVTPLRDAIRTLQAEGLVTVQPRSGIRIFKPDTDLIKNTFQLRRLIEREAVRLATETASDQLIKSWHNAHLALRFDVEKGLEQPELGDRAAALDRSFHGALVGCLRNSVIVSVYNRNEEQIALIRLYMSYAMHGPVVEQTIAEHLALIEALARRDAAGAATAIDRHIDLALHRALGI
jgi:DNA-binding GntR family transcriptional regulator